MPYTLPDDVLRAVDDFLDTRDRLQRRHHVCAHWRRRHAPPPTRSQLRDAFCQRYALRSAELPPQTVDRLACLIERQESAPRGKHVWFSHGVVHVHVHRAQHAALVVTSNGAVTPVCLRTRLQLPPVDVTLGGALGRRAVSALALQHDSLIVGCSRGTMCVDISRPRHLRARWHSGGVLRGRIACTQLDDVLAIDGRQVLWQVDLCRQAMTRVACKVTAATHTHDGRVVVAAGHVVYTPAGAIAHVPFAVHALHKVDEATLLARGKHRHALVCANTFRVQRTFRAPCAFVLHEARVVAGHAHVALSGQHAVAWRPDHPWIALL